MFPTHCAIRRLFPFVSGVALFLLFLAAAPILAQFSAGTILGIVKDTSGASVPNATVTVINVDTQPTRMLKTGDDGAFRFPVLPIGQISSLG